jgi:hypothetical protein
MKNSLLKIPAISDSPIMRITFSADEQLIRRARERAKAMGTTLDQLLREFIERLVEGHPNPHALPGKYRLSQRQSPLDPDAKP